MTTTMPQIPPTIAAHIDRFTGRAWLLPPLLEWLVAGEPRIFLLTGGPGTGKSMISAWLAGHGPAPADAPAAEQLARLRDQVAGAHFCQANSRNLSPQAFAESIANQLTANVPGFGDALAATLAERVQIQVSQQIGAAQASASITGVSIGRLDLGTLGDELSFDRAFTQPVKKLYESGYDKQFLILVDALDEAQTYAGQSNLVQLLAKLADLPPQVRILATTRPDPRVLMYYRDTRQLDLITDAPPDSHDVRRYATARLASAATGLDAAGQERLAGQVADKAAGVFLYAALVLEDLLPRLPAAADLDAYPLPERLNDLYQRFLLREVGKDDTLWYDLYEPLLGLIAVAQGDGLTTPQLTALVGRDVRQALRASKQYLAGELPNGPFRPFHRSFADFLLEDEDNIDRHIDAAAMHRRIADYYWGQYQNTWSTCRDQYALRYTPFHLWQAYEHLEGATQSATRQQLADILASLLTDIEFLTTRYVRQLRQPSRDSMRWRGLERFVGRRWVFSRLDAWLAAGDPAVFLLIGAEGSGKTWLAKKLVDINEGDSTDETWSELAPNRSTISYAGGRDPLQWHRTAVSSVLDHLSTLNDSLAEDWRLLLSHVLPKVERVPAQMPATWANVQRSMEDPIDSAKSNLVQKSSYEAIAAVFEAYVLYSGKTLVVVFDDPSERLYEIDFWCQLLKLQIPKLRLVVLSRPDKLVYQSFGQPALRLEGEPDNTEDIREFLSRELGFLSVPDLEETVNIMVHICGTMMTAALVIDNYRVNNDRENRFWYDT